MHLGFGADIHAAGRLVHNQDRRASGQPFGQHDLLLIAARKGAYRIGEAVRLEAQFARPVTGRLVLRRAVHQGTLTQPVQDGEGGVALNGHVHHEALLPPVLGHQANAGVHGGEGVAAANGAALHADGAAVQRVNTEDRPGHFAASRSDQAGETYDFAAPHLETYVAEHPAAGEALDRQRHLSGSDGQLGVQFLNVAANHAVHDAVDGVLLAGTGIHPAAVAHDGQPLAFREGFFQSVGNE